MMKVLSLVFMSLALGCTAPIVKATESLGRGMRNTPKKKRNSRGPKKVLTAVERDAKIAAGAKKRAERAAKKKGLADKAALAVKP